MEELKSILAGLRHIAKQLDTLNPKEIPSQSEDIANLHASLVQVKLQMKPLFTDSSGYTGKYASYPAIAEHIREPLGENGLCFTQELTEIDDKLYVLTTLRHESGQWIRSKTRILLPKREEIANNKDYNQECGKAITYMRRYALECMMGIKADKEDFDGK